MLSPDERLLIGLKALERLKPALLARRARHSQEELADRSAAEVSVSASGEAQTAFSCSISSLQNLLVQAGPLSPFSVILGACEDGLPFLLDLTNSAPGAILITGGPKCGKTRLLHSILDSAAILNPPEQVSFSLLAGDPDEYSTLRQYVNCQEVIAIDHSTAEDVVYDLSETVEQRRRGHPAGQALILAIDNLASYVHNISEDTLARLCKIVRHGPRLQVWTMAAVMAQDIAQIPEPLLAPFRTRLMGRIDSRGLATQIAGGPGSGAEHLLSGEQFSVPFGEEWIRFRICESEV